MTAKSDYNFVLWGVPRFHRSTNIPALELAPERAEWHETELPPAQPKPPSPQAEPARTLSLALYH